MDRNHNSRSVTPVYRLSEHDASRISALANQLDETYSSLSRLTESNTPDWHSVRQQASWVQEEANRISKFLDSRRTDLGHGS